MSIRNRFLIPAVVGLLVLGLVTAALASEIFSAVLSREVQRSHDGKIDAIHLETELVATRALELASVLAGLPAVVEAFQQAQRGNIDDEHDETVQAARQELRRRLAPLIRRHRRDTGGQELRAHFHLPNARSFLRVWRAGQTRRGGQWVDASDDLSSFRHTVVEINETGQPSSGIELGRGGFTIRGLVPVRNQREARLGSAEVLAPFGEMLAESLSQPHQHFALLMDSENRSITTELADTARFPEVGTEDQRYVMVMTDDRDLALQNIDWELIAAGRQAREHRWHRPFYTSVFPVLDVRDRVVGVVWFASDQSDVIAAERHFQRNLLLSVVGLIVTLSMVLFVAGRRAFRPLTETISRMEKIAADADNLGARLDVHGEDEISQLGRSFNRFVERLQSSFSDVTRNTARILERVSQLTCDQIDDPPENCIDCRDKVLRAQQSETEARTIGDVTRQTEDIAEKVDDVLSAWRAAEADAEAKRRQLIQADKLASLGVLVAGVAHEINNPNSFIMLNAPTVRQVWDELVPILDRCEEEEGDLLIGTMPYQKIREWIPTLLGDIENGSERIRAIVSSLKDFARQETETTNEEVDLNEVVRSAVVLTENRLKKSTTNLNLQLAPDLPPVRGSFQRIEQVVINLILNACDALTNKDDAITISTIRGTPDERRVALTVEDEGQGMSPETLAKIKDPFFTTKRTCGGTGLGLSVSDGIVRDLGGSLEFKSRIGEGTVASLCLPLEEPSPQE